MHNQKNQVPNTSKSDQKEHLQNHESIIERLAKNKWVIVASWIIGLFGAFGGVAGVIAINDYFDRRAKFDFFPFLCITGNTGTVENDAALSDQSAFLLVGTIHNEGQKPLFIKYIKMEAILDGSSVQCTGLGLTKRFGFTSSNQRIYLDSIETLDFDNVRMVQPNEVVYGFSLYITRAFSQMDIDQAEDIRFRLTCIDFQGNTYESEARKPQDVPLLDMRYSFRRFGITVVPIDSTKPNN